MRANGIFVRPVTRLSRRVAPLLVASGFVACGGMVIEPSAGSDDGRGEGGDIPSEAGAARDGGVAPRDGGSLDGDAATTGEDAAPSPCGDGVLVAGEACDDGNASSADGCSSKCQIEPGWTCAGAPTVCKTTCGDGIVAGDETCDDEITCPGTCRRTSWSRRYGDGVHQTTGVAVDGSGAAIITGSYRGTLDFGGGPLVSTGILDVFIAKVDADGKHVWSRRFGGTGDDRATAVATDSAGNVVVTGVFSNTIDFGGGPLVSSGSWDVFAVKLDAAGHHLWSKRFGDSNQQEGNTVAFDAAGGVVLGGMFWGGLDLGGGLLTSGGATGAFVAKLDAAGNHVWSRRFSPSARQRVASVAVSGSSDVFVTGGCSGPVDFGGGSLAAIGDGDGFLVALDAAGQHRWSRRWGVGNVYSAGTAVEVDAAGDVVLAGYAEGSLDLGSGPLPGKGRMDVVVGKFSPTGTAIFTRRFGSVQNEMPSSLATDASNDILLTGYYEGALDFGHGPLAHVGNRNVFVAKLDATGAPVWSKGYGSAATGTGVATDATGNVFATGYFEGNISFGGPPLTSAGQPLNVFLAKLGP